MRRKSFYGQRFNRFIVISEPFKESGNHLLCTVRCDCGTIKNIKQTSVVNGYIVSCGCKNIERLRKKATENPARLSHGCAKKANNSPEYRTWNEIKRRCYNKKCKQYKYYGERGITMCDKWIHSFDYFLEDMGLKPTKEHSIERIDNNKGYDPSNCKWATKLEQANNKRNNHKFLIDNIILSTKEFSEVAGLNITTVYENIYKGVYDDLLILPLRPHAFQK